MHNRCSISVQPNDNVCQLRIDLLDFSLAPPNGDGTCSTDVISISGSASNVPLLCGENAGQHLIADFTGTNPISIVIKSTASYTFGRHWNIRLSQIACDSGNRGKGVRPMLVSYQIINKSIFQCHRVACNTIVAQVVWFEVLTMQHRQILWLIRLVWKVHGKLQI